MFRKFVKRLSRKNKNKANKMAALSMNGTTLADFSLVTDSVGSSSVLPLPRPVISASLLSLQNPAIEEDDLQTRHSATLPDPAFCCFSYDVSRCDMTTSREITTSREAFAPRDVMLRSRDALLPRDTKVNWCSCFDATISIESFNAGINHTYKTATSTTPTTGRRRSYLREKNNYTTTTTASSSTATTTTSTATRVGVAGYNSYASIRNSRVAVFGCHDNNEQYCGGCDEKYDIPRDNTYSSIAVSGRGNDCERVAQMTSPHTYEQMTRGAGRRTRRTCQPPQGRDGSRTVADGQEATELRGGMENTYDSLRLFDRMGQQERAGSGVAVRDGDASYLTPHSIVLEQELFARSARDLEGEEQEEITGEQERMEFSQNEEQAEYINDPRLDSLRAMRSYTAALKLFQIENDFVLKLNRLQQLRVTLQRLLSVQQSATIFRNIDKILRLSEYCVDHLRVALDSSHNQRLHPSFSPDISSSHCSSASSHLPSSSSVLAGRQGMSVAEVYRSCLRVLCSADVTYRHGLSSALRQCQRVRDSSATGQRFRELVPDCEYEEMTRLLVCPIYHLPYLSKALRYFQATCTGTQEHVIIDDIIKKICATDSDSFPLTPCDDAATDDTRTNSGRHNVATSRYVTLTSQTASRRRAMSSLVTSTSETTVVTHVEDF